MGRSRLGQDRQGMELAVNTLVVLILGIVILTGGIALVYNIFHKTATIPDEVSRQTQEQLFNILLSSKQKIAVLNNVQEVARGDSATYPVAFQNQDDAAEFKITIPIKLLTPSCSSSCPSAFALSGPYELKRYESQALYVVVDVPKGADSGEYVFNVEVMKDGAVYARTKVHAVVE